MIKKLMSIMILGSFAVLAQAQVEVYQEGTHYQRLIPVQPNGGEQIEVIEFFSYACGHCYNFEPFVSKWKKSKPAYAKLTLLPAVFSETFIPLAQAHFAIETMGEMDKLHRVIFDAIHKSKKPVNTLDEIATIVAEAGVNREKFLEVAASFPVDTAVRKTQQAYTNYRISGVPGVAIDGQYFVTGQMAGSYPEFINIISYLVDKSAQRLKPKKAEQKKTTKTKQK